MSLYEAQYDGEGLPVHEESFTRDHSPGRSDCARPCPDQANARNELIPGDDIVTVPLPASNPPCPSLSSSLYSAHPRTRIHNTKITVKKIWIDSLSSHIGNTVTLHGWLYNKRSSGKIRFLVMRDGTGLVQGVVAKDAVREEVFNRFDQLTQESSFSMTGVIRREPRAPGGFEMTVTDIDILEVAVDYPITPKEHGVEFLMDRRHLWLRSSRQHAIIRIRHEIISAIRDFFDERGFVLLDAPIFTPAACEGTSTLFESDYFALG